MSADPWDSPGHEPTLTVAELAAIKGEIWDGPWNDPARFPECLLIAVDVLGDLALHGGPYSRQAATQGLRHMLRRTLLGGPLDEPQEPTW